MHNLTIMHTAKDHVTSRRLGIESLV